MPGRPLRQFVVLCRVRGKLVSFAVEATSAAAAKRKAERIAADLAARTDPRGLLHRQAEA